MALVAQVVEADALLLAVEVHNGGQVVRVLALVAARADALGEVKADLRLAAALLLLPALLLPVLLLLLGLIITIPAALLLLLLLLRKLLLPLARLALQV